MTKQIQLLIASNNQHKIKEFKSMLSTLAITVISPDEIGGITEVEETGSTFEENARLKAVTIAERKKLYVFADDSGLEVEALSWRPGIRSARYAGPCASDLDRINKLLTELDSETNRKARFVCVIAISDPKGNAKTFRGEVYGQITHDPRGILNFGYDPIFQPDGYDKTFAELQPEVKNCISHRANAMKKALLELNNILHCVE
jgi:non-canonical purine NTP pyrophosphatase (RdgB/HAM1 family)